MNKLSLEDRAKILHLLCEGMSVRAVTRLTGASKNTVFKLLSNAGRACLAFHDEHVRGLKSSHVEVNQISSFTYAKDKDVPTAKAAPEGAGETWTWTAIDSDSKLIVSYLVGGRDGEHAVEFIQDVAGRIDICTQLSADGLNHNIAAVADVFGEDIDFGQIHKIYGNAKGERGSPAILTGIKKRRVQGRPGPDMISTGYGERHNLTMRMQMRRFNHLTNGFSKKVIDHAYAVALHMMFYNFVRIHKTLRVTPAMAAGVSDRLWEIADLAKLVENAEAKPGARGLYKKA